MAATSAVGIRERVQAASTRIRRVKRLDRFATGFITLGGVFIIVSVSFIFLFIFGQALPLFRPAQGRALGALKLATPGGAPPLAVGVDEYQHYLYQVLPDGSFAFYRVKDGTGAKVVPPAAGSPAALTVASDNNHYVAAGSSDGKLVLSQVRFVPRYEQQQLVDLEVEVRPRGAVEVDPGHRPVRDVSYLEREGWITAAALLGDNE
ncbi:MAG TPA: hypothetical protein VF310_03115, partial [Vicinamibacteria bacterium]